MMTAVSLFAGIGGFDLALARAGVRTVAAVEINDPARGVVADHFPDTALFEDVTEVTGAQLRAAGFVPDGGLLTGGFPCQDLSVAGRRAGLAGERSGLFFEIARLADELKPTYLLLENVPGLLSSHGGRDMGAVLGALSELGYRWAYRVLDAQFFGVPQRRRRVFIVASAGGAGASPGQVLLEPQGRVGHSAALATPREGTARGTPYGLGSGGGDVATLGTFTGGFRTTDIDGVGAHVVMPARQVAFALRGRDGGAMPEIAGDGQTVSSLRSASGGSSRDYVATFVKGRRAGENDASPESWRESDIAPTVDAAGHGPRTATAVAYSISPESGQGADLRATEVAVAPALSATAEAASTDRGLRIATATAVRRITPLECERLQGFPDNWTLTSDGRPQKDSPRYRQIGNAVAVPVVEWIAHRLVAADNALEGAA